MKQHNIILSDRDIATIVWNFSDTPAKKYNALCKLLESSQDKALCLEIRQRIAYDKENLRRFHEYRDGYFYAAHIYTAEYDDIIGHFSSAELAKEYALRKNKPFCIGKFQIVGVRNSIIIPQGEPNPRPEAVNGERFPYRGAPVSECSYNENGELLNHWGYEMSREETRAVDDWGIARFESRFVVLPNPFHRGDIVCTLKNPMDRGIVITSQNEWQELVAQSQKEDSILDICDASITVYFFKADGTYDHEHIAPIQLDYFCF